jgi:hypothetical protein
MLGAVDTMTILHVKSVWGGLTWSVVSPFGDAMHSGTGTHRVDRRELVARFDEQSLEGRPTVPQNLTRPIH